MMDKREAKKRALDVVIAATYKEMGNPTSISYDLLDLENASDADWKRATDAINEIYNMLLNKRARFSD